MAGADIALILAFDGSASVTYDEFNLMTRGCGSALRDQAVMAGLTGGPLGLSYSALVLWSGHGAQETLLDWTRIDGPKALDSFAQAVEDVPRIVRAGETAIGEALAYCEKLLALAPGPARRTIIDMVGDGRSNAGAPPGPIRDRLAGKGVTINGLCILHEEPDLLQSYEREVIGGPGAFALTCHDFQDFRDAIQQKLQQEVASRSSMAGPARA